MCSHCKGELVAYVEEQTICLGCGCSFEGDALFNQSLDCDGVSSTARRRMPKTESGAPPVDSVQEEAVSE